MIRNTFADRSARVAFVDSTQAIRQTGADALKELGFSQITPLPSLAEVWSLLEGDALDWIIAPLAPTSELNALQILELCMRQMRLFRVRFSLIINPDESLYLPKAFELGALSWHPKMTSAAAARHEMGRLITLMANKQWDDCLTAAEYLCEWLGLQNRLSELSEVLEKLLSLYPGRSDLMMKLGRTQLRLGKVHAARLVFERTLLLDDSLHGEIKFLLAQHLGTDDNTFNTFDAEPPISALGIHHAAVVDSDSAARRLVTTTLKNLGTPHIHEFEDGEAAWLAMATGAFKPQLLITEWVLPKLSAAFLLQRLDDDSDQLTTSVVISSRLALEDLPTLREMGALGFRQKPLDQKRLVELLVEALSAAKRPTNLSTARRSLLSLLRRGQRHEAASLRARLATEGSLDLGGRYLLDAELAYFDQQYKLAQGLAWEALRRGGDPVYALTLMGRIMLKRQCYDVAAKFLEKAHTISPFNVERLCLMAEAYQELEDVPNSDAALQEAKDLDQGSRRILNTDVKLQLSRGQIAKARALMASLKGFDELIGFINNKAVSLSRSGRFEEGLGFYRKALEALPLENTTVRTVLLYNLALAHLRQGSLASALSALEHLPLLEMSEVAQKAYALKSKLQQAQLQKRKVQMHAPSEQAPNQDPAAADKPLSEQDLNYLIDTEIALHPGDSGCCKIYFAPPADADAVSRLLQTPIPYSYRPAVVKDVEPLR